jgi:hypothetical protein
MSDLLTWPVVFLGWPWFTVTGAPGRPVSRDIGNRLFVALRQIGGSEGAGTLL